MSAFYRVIYQVVLMIEIKWLMEKFNQDLLLCCVAHSTTVAKHLKLNLFLWHLLSIPFNSMKPTFDSIDDDGQSHSYNR